MVVRETDDVGSGASMSEQVLFRLRQDILHGKLTPGSRLPSLRLLSDQFDTSLNTIQRAVSELVQDGFLETNGRAGTHVTPHPPHLTRIGVGFATAPGYSVSHWSKFHQAIHLSLQAARLGNGQRFVSFFRLSDSGCSSAGQQELEDDIRRHRLAGMVMVGPAWSMDMQSQLIDPTLPRICISRSGESSIPSIMPDSSAWLDRALGTLAGRGRKRIAFIDDMADGLSLHDNRRTDLLMRKAGEAGVISEPVCHQHGSVNNPHGISQAVRLLMSLPADRRPDGLVICDDNLIDPAVHGLLQSGVSVGSVEDGGDVDVVAHANFPFTVAAPYPLIYIGYDVRWMLARARDIILDRRTAEYAPMANADILTPVITADEFNLYNDPLNAGSRSDAHKPHASAPDVRHVHPGAYSSGS